MAIFSLQSHLTDLNSWTSLARRCEALGFDAMLTADHPGIAASPFVALAAAAAVTSTVGLGSYVSNAGVREPLLLAADVATLDVVSGGRARLGLGAGHTPGEWAAVGRSRPDVGGRIRRCTAVAEAVLALLDGEEIDVDTPDLVARAARLSWPVPVQRRIPLTIGGGNARLLRWAGAHADVVGLTGFGRTLADGHSHEVRWRAHEIDEQLEQVARGAAGRGRTPALEALVQHVHVTDDAGAAVADVVRRTGIAEAELLASPFVLAGTAEEIISAIREHESRWGVTRYVVRAAVLDRLAPILPRLLAET
ncbi:LLM class flavin-dependent oxidoreductase [Nonomuraea sp. NN258]|uniref:LLM class flavin-dependent oxidoreductase n=1 Tax=Nonomuraea antri TaxID=2730852 RepID=UPI00156819A4|nr:LLM class flavin-dependent oxidoreductase [Nonomuraea antri]NRQ31864.1 LLM class flavin-dependent oxidoreductase [Nonomuraea antri]